MLFYQVYIHVSLWLNFLWCGIGKYILEKNNNDSYEVNNMLTCSTCLNINEYFRNYGYNRKWRNFFK